MTHPMYLRWLPYSNLYVIDMVAIEQRYHVIAINSNVFPYITHEVVTQPNLK